MRTPQSEALFGFYKNAARLAQAMNVRADRELPEGMTLSRFELLDLLAETAEPLSPLSIARKLHMTPAAVTHHLRHLGAGGLVKVETDKDDRRAKLVSLTPQGKGAHRAAMIGLSGLTTQLLGRFSADEFHSPNSLLEKFADWLENPDKNADKG